ncbi:DUF2510 domain-containing protein [Cellulomonas sp. ICMP 17802]|uniref:DUF2510 domain-containing protein n=1 Tax=Cellulomonas sp. ICMP 17802 TaxID=3239199 RepID=UPI00351B1971
MSTPPPGWYPSPDAVERQRWWDGVRWTGHVRQVETPEPEAGQPWLPQPRSTFDPERVVVVEGVGRSAPPGAGTVPQQTGPTAVQPYGMTALATTVGPEQVGATPYGPPPDASTGLPRPAVGYGAPSPYAAAARPSGPEQTEGAAALVQGLVGSPRRTGGGGLVGGVMTLLFGLVFSAISLIVVPQITSAHAGADETLTRGTVVDLHESTTRKGARVCSPEASFVVDGTSYRARAGYSSSTCPTLGASVDVIYTTAAPGGGDARLPAPTSTLLMMAVFPVVGLCIVAGGLIGTIRGGASVLSGWRRTRG